MRQIVALILPRLCLLIPRTGGRLIEAGDEEFLRLQFDDSMFNLHDLVALTVSHSPVPVIIVFTQYDLLCDQITYDLTRSGQLKDMNATQRKERIEEESDKYFNENCVKPLQKIAHRPKRLK